MDSDSDSDASHVSATPPKNPIRRPPLARTLGKSYVPRPLNFKATSDSSNTKSASKQEELAHCAPTSPRPRLAPSPDPSFLPGTCILIRRSADRGHRVSADHSIDLIPAGFFSTSASFSKLRKHCSPTNFAEDSLTIYPSVNVKGQSIGSGSSVKNARKHFNLVGGDAALKPMIKKECRNWGNFVKYNMKGYKHNLKRKGGKTSYKISKRRPYRRRKTTGSDDTEGDDQAQADKEGMSSLDCQLVEEVVLDVRNEISDGNLVKLLKVVYGYDSFREGQLDAIKIVLSGSSALLVLPTGAGKSLCYQIPALVSQGVTLVVSPLVALMIDQMKQLPKAIRGGFLSSSQTLAEAEETIRMLQNGIIKVLFISPERFLNVEFLQLFSTTSPVKVSLVVVDEAHCISEWSHNFRPSYMRIKASMLQLNAECVLAMTATATRKTLDAIISALGIPASNLIEHSPLRNNLQLSVATTANRMKDLLILLKSPPYFEIQSIIVYCKFQSETELVSKYLCDGSIAAKCYHSGLPAKDRSCIQGLFSSNKIKVVVATVAFGMGLDKKDVGAVIHYSLPESLEEYVQEIGRAGRDGSFSYCHLFFDEVTYFKLRSLMHSNGVDEYGISQFLGEVFISGMGAEMTVRSLVKESASRKFDMKEEVMLTLLTYLELGDVQYLRLLPQLNVTCTVNFHMTLPAVLSHNDDIVAAIMKQSKMKHGQFVFNIISLSNGLGVSLDYIMNYLTHLKLNGEITYETKDPAYCYILAKFPTDFCSLAARLARQLSDVEKCQVQKLDRMYLAVHSTKTCGQQSGCYDTVHTTCLHNKISDYFKEVRDKDTCERVTQSRLGSPFLRADIKVFLQSNSQSKFTPRAVARIMHGLSSPAYPSSVWSKSHFWGRYVQTDFKVVMEAAKLELLNVAAKNAT